MVTYRLATENDYQNINDFHNRIYQKNRTMNEFLWEFHDCPFGKSIYVIATDEGKVVGTNCVIPIVLANSKGELVLTGKSEDTLVDPEYRGQEIFKNIYDYLFNACTKNGIKIIWGYTTAKKPFEKIGFQVPFDHQQSLLVKDIFNSYRYLSALNQNNRLKQKAQIFALCVLSKLKCWKGNVIIQKPKVKIFEVDKITDKVADLIESIIKKNPELFYIYQSKEFQQWRIYDNPNFHKVHTFSAYDSNDKLVSLIVLNSNPNGVAYIIQSSFDNSISDNEKVKILMYTYKSIFKRGIKLIRNWHFNHNPMNREEIEIFKKANFIIYNRGISFVWKEINSTELNPHDFALSRVSTQGVI
jgi:N-acetylglutamate synthase-like GNAT family acetyltransferase